MNRGHARGRAARRIGVALAALLALAAPSPSAALNFGEGALPIAYEPGAFITLTPGERIVIEGVYDGERATQIILRVDDAWAPTDAGRFEIGFAVEPGPFAVDIGIDEIVGADGAPLDMSEITRVVLFGWDDAGTTITRFETIAGSPAPSPDAGDTAAAGEKTRRPRPAPEREPAPEPAAYDFGVGRAPLEGEVSGALDLSSYDEILIEGVAETDGGLWIVLRIDDGESSGYGSRYNLELELTEGPFRLRAPLGGLKTPSGRLIDPSDIRLVHFWPFHDDDAVIEVTRFEARSAPRLPNGAIGYAFGHPEAALPAGFERIGPTDPRVFGEPYAVARPTPDPLVANGLRGVREVRLPDVPPGRYRVTVWAEDPGEWEHLPHPLRRVIIANGVDLRRDALGADQWIAQRYLRGLEREHTPADDAYTAYGAYRGEPSSAAVEVGADGLTIVLGGDSHAASYISAVLVEPAGSDAAEAAVEAARAEWYRQFWRLDPAWREDAAADAPGAATLRIDGAAASLTGPDGAKITGLSVVTAPGAGARVTLSAASDVAFPATARIVAPSDGAETLDGMLWTGRWRLDRRRPEDTLLSLSDNTLLPTGAASIGPDYPRRYEMWFEPPADARPGVYTGAIEITTPAGVFTIPIDVVVLDVALPDAADPAGFYLVEAPHLTWFAGEPLRRQRQAACDVRLMTRFGLHGSAPAVRPPQPTNILATTLDLRLAQDLGLTPPWLAYNPVRPLQFDFAPEDGAALIGAVEAELRAAGAATPAWSVADELSNPGDTAHEVFRPWVEAIRAAAPGVLLAGHLNNPDDRQYLDAFDVAVVNEGFGLDADVLEDLADRGIDVWLYNTWEPRVTAGYWLWATDAERYVQWHARMPTADPFDPIDGREGDVMAILPMAEICAPQPALHRDFLRLAEGVVDQRWLLWLDAQDTDDAAALRARLRDWSEDGWRAAVAAGDAEMARIRAAIIALAQ